MPFGFPPESMFTFTGIPMEKRLNSLCLIVQPFFGDEDASNAVH
jgi:hypothetical protein